MKVPATAQKLRGGYYTPKEIGRFLAEWAIQEPTNTVLEPSCGDGSILDAAVDVLLRRGADVQAIPALVHGVELDEAEARRASTCLAGKGMPILVNVLAQDFFEYCHDRLLRASHFDVILGNPPFIRYQHFEEPSRTIAFHIMESAGLRPTRLTNAWVPFLVCSTLLLKPNGGRLAMVIPAELLQTTYAAELRRFLVGCYSTITLFTFRELVFDGIQQEVVLFLGERDGGAHTGIKMRELGGLDDLLRRGCLELSGNGLVPMPHTDEKWTQYYLDSDQIDLLRALRGDRGLTVARKVLAVDVGVVTGLNDFFVLTQREAEERSLIPYTKPVVTRSAHLVGACFGSADLATNLIEGRPSLLLCAPSVPNQDLPAPVRRYVEMGEKAGYHTGYKCRIREHWYVVPSVWTPDAFLLRQIHGYPKLALNETPATCTDTIHRVKLLSSVPAKTIASAFLNSLTFAFAEVLGRSYGGGVLELEPNEAEALPLPLRNAEALDFDQLNLLLLGGELERVLDITDKTLLVDGLGLSIGETMRLRNAWTRLRDRRIHRNHRPKIGRVDPAA